MQVIPFPSFVPTIIIFVVVGRAMASVVGKGNHDSIHPASVYSSNRSSYCFFASAAASWVIVVNIEEDMSSSFIWFSRLKDDLVVRLKALRREEDDEAFIIVEVIVDGRSRPTNADERVVHR